ncbi:MAG: ATP-binding protein, partial [Planctomycetota bacterium]|nr:ATP-binding protein [Planctomycetota bacterium]
HPDLLRRAMLCLVHNAVAAAGSPKYVKMELETVEPVARITIINPASGNTSEGLIKTGYGLADARSIITDQKGELQDPQSEPGQTGLWVTMVTLPLAQDPDVEGECAHE